jgi:hypothetical protein
VPRATSLGAERIGYASSHATPDRLSQAASVVEIQRRKIGTRW